MRRPGVITRAALALVAVMVVLVLLAMAVALVRYDRAWMMPATGVASSTDPALIERGRYIVFGPGRCADCHTPDSSRDALNRGEDVELTGGPGEHTYLGTWTAPNLTPDPITGIGRVTDAQLARMLRYGVNRDGHIALPFMDAYKDLADEDLVAILSYLRSVPPRAGVRPDARINLLGKIALAYFIEPYAPAATPPARLTPEPTPAYGGYVANTLAGCSACHTARNLRTGTFLSPPFAGGLPFKSREHPGQVYVSPNLTPDATTGHITEWTEEAFVQRFRAGLLIADSPMPWAGFSRMTDTDLRALYRYLHSLPPVRHDVGPVVQKDAGTSAG